MFNFNLLFLVIIVLFPQDGLSIISDKRLCANENCTERISLAKTIIRYNSPEKGLLSVPQNQEVTIYSKSAGSNTDLWGVEYNKKRGYLNKKFLRETRVFKKVLPFLVDTEFAELEKVPSSDHSEDILPNPSQTEVIDGTTITLSPNDINPSATEENIKPTESVLNAVIEGLSFGLLNSENGIEKNKEAEFVDNDDISIEDSESDDEEDEDEEDGKDNEEDPQKEEKEGRNVSVEEEKIEEQMVANPNKYKGEVNISAASELENNEINTEEIIITKGSITSRSLLQHEDNVEETISPPEIVKKTTKNSEEIPNTDTSNESIIDKVVENIKSEEISSEDVQESVLVTTESMLDVQFDDDSANIESITENPGKLEENFEEKMDNIENKDVVGDDRSESFWNFGLEDIKKDILDAVFEEGENSQKGDDIKENIVEDISKEENVQSQSVLESESQKDEENVSIQNIVISENHPDNLEKTDENIKVIVEDVPKKENVASESGNQIQKVEQNVLTQDVEKTENNPDNLEKTDNNINIAVEDIPKKEDVPAESVNQMEKVEDNVSTQDIVKAENNPDLEKTNENINIEENLSSQNPIQFEPIQAIDMDLHPQNSIRDDQITNNSEESIDSRVPIPQIDNHNNENLIQNEYSLNGNLDFIQTNPESAPNIAEDHQSINTTPENLSENLSENTELDLGNEQPDSGGWYNSLFGGATDNVDVVGEKGNENVLEDSVQENIQGNNNPEYTKPGFQEENIHNNEKMEQPEHNFWTNPVHSNEEIDDAASVEALDSCSVNADDCSNFLGTIQNQLDMDLSSINFSDVLNLVTVLGITGITVVVFLLGYIAIDKSRRETPLVAKINKLEKALLVSMKENQILAEQVAESETEFKEQDVVTSKIYTELEDCNRQLMEAKSILEEQVQSLEKELENSTEVGFELNRMLSEILKSQSGSDLLVANIENLQRQLVEQQGTINSINDTLNLKDTENHELQLELEIKNKKVIDLQAELDKMALSLMKAEEEKDQVQSKLEIEIQTMKEELSKIKVDYSGNKNKLTEEINGFKKRCSELKKAVDLKSSEYNILKENFNQIKSVKNNHEVMKDLLQSVTSKAELAELQKENKMLNELLVQERQIKVALEKRAEEVLKEVSVFKEKYDEVDKEKLEAQTKLEVLGNYFKEREAELQRELAKQEALWQEKQGEATSSTERNRYIKEELQNFKSQNELLKQEIVSQEVELKSQISVLEKKAHESWLSARQAERRLEDAKQEAAQLRNRLTLKERSFIEDKGQHRVLSPLEQNGEIIESPASPPLLYSTHDHLTTSPPLPGLPPFLPPPPPGVHASFMPPPIPGVVPGFMPPPPSMFPVDHHRPPPLGRMSSPPLNSRYSPDSSRYSDRYDDRNNSPSPPPYDEDDRYGPASLPLRHTRPYSPYRNDRREYKRPNAGGGRTNGRNKGASSGSENSNSEPIDRTNRHHTKI